MSRCISSMLLAVTVVALLVCIVTLSPALMAGQQQEVIKAPPTDTEALAGQIKELQKQVAALQSSPRIIAAGTATYERPAEQDNRTGVHIKLHADVAGRLGDDYIVLLTPRLLPEGYPYLIPYWKKSADGFDIFPVDTTIGSNSSSSYATRNKTHLIDWIVVKK